MVFVDVGVTDANGISKMHSLGGFYLDHIIYVKVNGRPSGQTTDETSRSSSQIYSIVNRRLL